MCIQSAIQSKIARLTNDGETIAQFLADTMQGSSDPAIKICHRIDAAKMLTKYGIPQQNIIALVPPEAEDKESSPSHTSKSVTAPTLRDIISYPVARYIRERTDNGETLVHTLCHIMEGGDYNPDPFTGYPKPTVKPRERLAAAKELLRRAFGEYRTPRANSVRLESMNLSPMNLPKDKKLEFEHDPLNTDLAKLVRDKTNDGIDTAELLIDIAENTVSEDEWQPGLRLSAAKELLHRAYDLNYDAVTWEHIQAYNYAEHPVRLDEEAKRVTHRERVAALLKEYDEAWKANDEDAMTAAEKKYANYIKHGDESDPDEPEQSAEYHSPPIYEEQAKTNEKIVEYPAEREHNFNRRQEKDGHIAAAITYIPKLTIPLNNRSP